jgi:1,4-dihydroxy-2-naphthoate octaprenyltransferase
MRGGKLDWMTFAAVHLFGMFNALYIVYANDYADIETDKKNTTFNIFSGGSRVLVNREIEPKSLKRASILMASLCLLCGVFLASLRARYFTVPLIAAGLALLWMYSFSPVKLSYRGGGELLQTAGVGIVLPLIGYYAQSGRIADFPWETMAVILPTQAACAIATSLPDEPSDRLSNKRTATVLLGLANAKIVIAALNMFSIAAFVLLGWLDSTSQILWLLLAAPIAATIVQQLIHKGEPGSPQLVIRVALAVFTTLSLMIALSVAAAFLVPPR